MTPRRASRLSMLIIGVAAITGCQSNPASEQRKTCRFAPGMTTETLAICGCAPAFTGNDGTAMLMSEEAQSNTRTVMIVSYMCPLGSAGVAKVTVVNGVVTGVYE